MFIHLSRPASTQIFDKSDKKAIKSEKSGKNE